MSEISKNVPPAGRGSVELKVSAEQTGGAILMHLQTLPPGAETLTHIHHNCEETVYPVTGTPAVSVDGKSTELGAGGSAVVPRGKLYATANKNGDEIQLPECDEFDIGRKNTKRHLTLDNGEHFSLGAPLACMELRVILEELPQRIPTLRLATDPEWDRTPTVLFRGVKSLPVEWNV